MSLYRYVTSVNQAFACQQIARLVWETKIPLKNKALEELVNVLYARTV